MKQIYFFAFTFLVVSGLLIDCFAVVTHENQNVENEPAETTKPPIMPPTKLPTKFSTQSTTFTVTLATHQTVFSTQSTTTQKPTTMLVITTQPTNPTPAPTLTTTPDPTKLPTQPPTASPSTVPPTEAPTTLPNAHNPIIVAAHNLVEKAKEFLKIYHGLDKVHIEHEVKLIEDLFREIGSATVSTLYTQLEIHVAELKHLLNRHGVEQSNFIQKQIAL